ncbi:hypothetical protein GCG21_09715 [Pseudactinotalea sp. HY160]|uniref:hypothetical protein n=1 Tax=Pseudactinotalea sp. HY160 TaxID=2654490 RepID=UPI00128B33C3|nr:hypothetical protein [Pseudactinotalea sp. HY160]MPV50274.1 hypothetical protein [Pseudactinotalea sp. HY160]
MLTVAYASHTAHLDHLTGQGLLVLPDPADDVRDPLAPGSSLHAADWNAAVRALAADGWELLEGWDGVPLREGVTIDGRDVLGLSHAEPVSSADDVETLAAAARELAKAARTSLQM